MFITYTVETEFLSHFEHTVWKLLNVVMLRGAIIRTVFGRNSVIIYLSDDK
jgi:hypothetical protein